jgi:quercetin dioxygenase-like cupin family protein
MPSARHARRGQPNIEATTLSILVNGSMRIFFATGQEALLAEQGDYILWPPGLAHRWQIEEDKTTVLTVRWPSRAGGVVSS